MAEESGNKWWAQVVAKAWADEDYKKRLLADPLALFKEEGYTPKEGEAFQVVEQKDPNTHILVLPATPEDIPEMDHLETRLASTNCCTCSG